MSESSWALSASNSFSPFSSAPTMMVRRSSRPCARPAADQRAQEQALGDQRRETDEEEGREPEPRNLAAELGEERGADEQQEHERPGRDHPRHLAKLAAEYLDVVDVGGLEADHRGAVMAKIAAIYSQQKPPRRHHIAEIERDADQAEQHEIGEAHRARDHDRRIGAADFLVGDGKGGRRQPAAPFDRRPVDGGVDRGRCRGI